MLCFISIPDNVFAPARLITRLIVVVVLCATACAHAAIPPAEKILPEHTLLMVTAPNSAKLRDIFAKSPADQLWGNPAMGLFRGSFPSTLRTELLAPLERELGLKRELFAGLAQGQCTFAITANGWRGAEGGKPAAILLLDAGDRLADLKITLDVLRNRWTNSGRSLRIEKVRDVEFMALTLGSNDAPGSLTQLLPSPADAPGTGNGNNPTTGATNIQIFLGRLNSLLIAGTDLKSVVHIVSRLAGDTASSLADDPEFQSCQATIFRNAQAFGWINAQALMEPPGKTQTQEVPSRKAAPDPFARIGLVKVLNAAGLANVKTLSIAFQDTPEGQLVQIHANVPESERKGLLKLLSGGTGETAPPSFVPGDAVKFMRWRSAGQQALDTLTNALSEISPNIMGTVDFILNTTDEAGKLNNPQFDLRRQLFGNLGDDIITFETRTGAGEPRSVTLIGSKKPGEMMAAMEVMFGALSPDGKAPVEQKFMGRKIATVMAMASLPGGPKPVRFRKLHMTHNDDYVLLATDEPTIENCLRGATGSGSLLEIPGVSNAMARVTGPGTSLSGFENWAETRRFEPITNQKISLTGTNAPAVPSPPLFEPKTTRCTFTVYGVVPDADGLTIRYFTPAPTKPGK